MISTSVARPQCLLRRVLERHLVHVLKVPRPDVRRALNGTACAGCEKPLSGKLTMVGIVRRCDGTYAFIRREALAYRIQGELMDCYGADLLEFYRRWFLEHRAEWKRAEAKEARAILPMRPVRTKTPVITRKMPRPVIKAYRR